MTRTWDGDAAQTEGAGGAEDAGPAELDRYDDVGLLGRGGMGVVRRVRDRELQRTVAMKVLGHASEDSAARFLVEAQITAQLQHPGVIPLYDLGRLPDGRPFFTMKEVKGVTLGAVIRDVHAAGGPLEWRATASGWTFRRLLDAFHRVCETVAYAHAIGVVHRDLKPENVLVGDFGEVLVVDWGVAKVLGTGDERTEEAPATSSPVVTSVSGMTGTPAYMAPEQAAGSATSASDVWALGAVLYEILANRAPFGTGDVVQVLARVLHGAPDPLPGDAPQELREICLRALERDLLARYPDAGVLANAVGRWLEGAHRRERALAAVAEADRLGPTVAGMRSSARALRREAGRRGEGLQPWDPVDRKRLVWEVEDRAAALERAAELRELEVLRALHGALNLDPHLPEAHGRLSDLYRAQHEAAVARRDEVRAEHAMALLRQHDRGRHARYLAGIGSFDLVTDPPATAELYRYELRDRRLVEVLDRSLGATPLRGVELPAGSWLVVLRTEGCEEVRWPLLVERERHQDQVPPGESAPHVLRLPRTGELDRDEVFVPAGWFWCGGDPEAAYAYPSTRLWVDDFVIGRHPVTNAQYLAFLEALGGDAESFAPTRDRSGFARGADGRWRLGADEAGLAWQPDWPVFFVHWEAANAYARWASERAGKRFRLPHEIEWEKAARGVDGRRFPWGDYFDPVWAAVANHASGRPVPEGVSSHPTDVSPYGVRGIAGNARDWCSNEWLPEPPDQPRVHAMYQAPAPGALVATRGGAFTSAAPLARCSTRFASRSTETHNILGFRMARASS